MYMAMHRQINQVPFDYIVPIHVGAALQDDKYARVTDATGENISEKNPQYCELTALYWMWKNTTDDYLGLCHYRRFFNLPEEKLIAEQLKSGNLILPERIYFKESLYDQYRHCHAIEEWDIMIEVVKSLYPDYFKAAVKVFSSNSLIPYNMFIANKQWLDQYCRWLFPVLSGVADKIQSLDPTRQRYIGFLSERLLTLFVFKNQFRVQECEIIDSKSKPIKQSCLGIAARNTLFNLNKKLKIGG